MSNTSAKIPKLYTKTNNDKKKEKRNAQMSKGKTNKWRKIEYKQRDVVRLIVESAMKSIRSNEFYGPLLCLRLICLDWLHRMACKKRRE